MTLVDISGTPYYLPTQEAKEGATRSLASLSERVDLLRAQGKLTDATLTRYYGVKRFEQIAESNALEGSTLSVGETEQAVLRGITLTGHDPAYSRDAQALAKAIDRVVELARSKSPTSLDQIKELHELIVGPRPGSGVFRSAEVRIRGSNHVPPTTWKGVMDGMESWATWSETNAHAHPILRATVLHAWLTHIHPFLDGNGRTARAILNLELIREGYPPVIIRRKDRERYLDSLGEADAGHLGELLDLVSQRQDDALRDLERVATEQQGYDAIAVRKKRNFQNRLSIWNAGVHLLVELLRERVESSLSQLHGTAEVKEFDELSVEDFMELSEGRPVGRQSWAFRVQCRYGTRSVSWLCWGGFLDQDFRYALTKLGSDGERPALLWSEATGSYPPWRQASGRDAPGGDQMTIVGDHWVLWKNGRTEDLSPTELADSLARFITSPLLPSDHL